MEETILFRDLAVCLLAATVSGWALQRLGFSAVVGYLLAGILIGPFSPVYQLVSDLNHIQFLAQVGLVFLMFSIGLGLSFARLQRMGLSIVAAVIISSILLFNACRLFGVAMGWDGFQTFFLAGTLMISSSAIIIKILDELNITHQRSGQLALGMTVLEDIVAVVMLTLFISMLKVGGGQTATVWNTLGALGTFVVFLVVIAVVSVPRILQWLSRDSSVELKATAVTGLVLLAAVWAAATGYSLALGAFVLGAVVAGTRHKDEVEKSFEVMHQIFGAVFFVAVGMMFDFRLLAEVWWLVLVVTLFTVVARPLACAFGLVSVGHSSSNALKAGLALTPIGEFAFVMMQVGKTTNVLPETFYALAIGVSLTTAIIGPLLTRRSDAICGWMETNEPKVLRETIALYHRWLAELHGRSNRSFLWKLTSRRLLHIAVQMFFASALIIFSRSLLEVVRSVFGTTFIVPHGITILYWAAFGLVLIAPLVALWRNVEALAMILAEGATRNFSRGEILRPTLEALLKGFGVIVLIAWFLLLVPFGLWVFWTLCAAAVALLFFAPLFWRRLAVLHNKLEYDFREKMKAASTLGASSGLPASVLEQPQAWNLQIDELVMPFRSAHSGRSISELGIRSEFGCSVMAIDRQGFHIANPHGQEKLFPGDKLLLLGTGEQLARAEPFLRGTIARNSQSEFEQIGMETVAIPESSPDLGKTLAELNLTGRFGIQVCGIERSGERVLIPPSTERLKPGDRLLLLSTHQKILQFQAYLQNGPGPIVS